MRRIVIAAAASIAALVFARAAPAAAPSAADRAAAPDPSLLRGALPNGLRYVILPNSTPKGAVSLRFYVRAGADEETEAERGAAHFVEHMAFEGSTRFPGDSVDAAFAKAGISAVRDQNAFTDAFGVDYVFDLQAATPEKLDLALDFLRAAGDGLSFDPAALVRERQVVLAEIAARRTGGTQLTEYVARFMTPQLLPPRRTPGGDAATLNAMDSASLRAFHDRWYRPDRTELVVVGDVAPEQMRERIARVFGGWRAAGPPPVEPEIGQVDPARPEAALAVTAPNFAQGSLQACRVAPRDPKLGLGAERWRREALDEIWSSALQERLAQIARVPDAPFTTAGAAQTDAYHTVSFTCLTATPKAGRWKEALLTLDREARRLALHGVQPGEAQRATATLAARVDEAAAASGTRPTDALARTLLASEIEGDAFTTPAEVKRTFALAEPELTAEAATQVFRRRWSEGGLVTVLVSTTPVTTPELVAARAEAAAAPPPDPPPPEVAVRWPYADFGPPGRVAARETFADPAFTRIRFDDGVVLNFKHTAFQSGAVQVRLAFGAGQPEVPPSRMTAALLGVATLAEGGLGKLDAQQVRRALQGRIWSVQLGFDRTRFTLSGATRPADLDVELQAMAAFLTDPGFRPEAQLRVPTLAETLYKDEAIDPIRSAQRAIALSLPRPHVYDLPPKAELAAVTAADMAAALRPALTGDALEVTIVGDVDEAAAVQAVARTLAALPPRRDASRPPADAARTRYGPAPPVITAHHIGLKDKAAVVAVWPLFVWEPSRQREVRALTLLREVMNTELRREVRERLGLTYTPAIDLSLDHGGDQGALTVAVETSADGVDATRAAILAVAARLSAPGGVDPGRLEQIRKPLLDDTSHRMETNGWWVNTLDGSAAHPFQLEQARTWAGDYGGIQAAEVQAAATRWLSGRPWIAQATPAPDAPATPAAVAAPQTPVPSSPTAPPQPAPPGGDAPG